jgi:hypothetical protein
MILLAGSDVKDPRRCCRRRSEDSHFVGYHLILNPYSSVSDQSARRGIR